MIRYNSYCSYNSYNGIQLRECRDLLPSPGRSARAPPPGRQIMCVPRATCENQIKS